MKTIFIIISLSFLSIVKGQVNQVDSFLDTLDYFDISNFQYDSFRMRNDFWVLVKVQNKEEEREVCVSMKDLKTYLHFTHKYGWDSISISKVDSIIYYNKDRKYKCDDESMLNRFFNYNLYSKEDLIHFNDSINLDALYKKAMSGQKKRYFSTKSDKYMVMLAHLLYKQGIYTTEYSCHGSILYIVNMEKHKRTVEKWRIEKLLNN